eukprot:6006047-Amphidinium_carterae.1
MMSASGGGIASHQHLHQLPTQGGKLLLTPFFTIAAWLSLGVDVNLSLNGHGGEELHFLYLCIYITNRS